MTSQYLYQRIDSVRNLSPGTISNVPRYIYDNLNPKFELRQYQKEAFENFIFYFKNDNRPYPLQTLFHMATGSGKTLIMAGLMIYLYKKGYRNFLFFVNLSNIVEKTKENFLNPASPKYLFNDEIIIDGEHIRINKVDNFQFSDPNAINICFTTIQGLCTDIFLAKENSITEEDFINQEIVFISDEAHHLNADSKKLSDTEKDNNNSWENNIDRLFHKNSKNILLEFTATCDLENESIKRKYEDKIIYDYTLKKYYQDKYSKDIVDIKSDLSIPDRMLQATIVSQYRLKIFQKNGLNIKPIILFKAQKTIEDNKKNYKNFLSMIGGLTGQNIENLFNTIDKSDELMFQIHKYLEDNNISYNAFANEIKDDFSSDHCLSVNDDKDVETRQILLNTLEEPSNPYRAIFEVKKLDEGWDVLNLFDIVRLYDSRQGGKKISSTTISEAQLIGRGARYCPFQLDSEQPLYQRKFDNDMTNEMRICETLYYYCKNDAKYIYELRSALHEIGLDLKEKVQRTYVLKESFKDDDFYKKGFMFINNRETVGRESVYELAENVRCHPYQYRAPSGIVELDSIMSDDEQLRNQNIKYTSKAMSIKDITDINYAIVNKTLMKYPIFKFSTLKSYFPNLKSTREFITSDKYLGSISITIQTIDGIITNEIMHNAVLSVINKIDESLSNIKDTFIGTDNFKQVFVRDVFKNKVVNYENPHEGGIGVSQNDPSVPEMDRIDLSCEDWFVYNDNYGTSEEKKFVSYFHDRYVERLKQIYDKIYLVRNEREFHIYSFANGLRFEPDYVLFLRRKEGDRFEQLQMFVEPKGEHLIEQDAWKEEFLLQMKGRAIPVLNFPDGNEYKIWGFHFFNSVEGHGELDDDLEELFNRFNA